MTADAGRAGGTNARPDAAIADRKATQARIEANPILKAMLDLLADEGDEW